MHRQMQRQSYTASCRESNDSVMLDAGYWMLDAGYELPDTLNCYLETSIKYPVSSIY